MAVVAQRPQEQQGQLGRTQVATAAQDYLAVIPAQPLLTVAVAVALAVIKSMVERQLWRPVDQEAQVEAVLVEAEARVLSEQPEQPTPAAVVAVERFLEMVERAGRES